MTFLAFNEWQKLIMLNYFSYTLLQGRRDTFTGHVLLSELFTLKHMKSVAHPGLIKGGGRLSCQPTCAEQPGGFPYPVDNRVRWPTPESVGHLYPKNA